VNRVFFAKKVMLLCANKEKVSNLLVILPKDLKNNCANKGKLKFMIDKKRVLCYDIR
jgi:hypothetical protein